MLYGWDISTSIVGLTCFSDKGKFLNAMCCDLRKVDGQLAKADHFKKWLETNTIANSLDENFHFIEERLGGFAGGRTSAQVLMKLAQFNAICSYILWNHHPGTHRQVSYLHPSTWKAMLKVDGLLIPKGSDKKEITLAFVRKQEPSFPVDLNKNGKVQPYVYDMADAYCIGRAGYRKLAAGKKDSGAP